MRINGDLTINMWIRWDIHLVLQLSPFFGLMKIYRWPVIYFGVSRRGTQLLSYTHLVQILRKVMWPVDSSFFCEPTEPTSTAERCHDPMVPWSNGSTIFLQANMVAYNGYAMVFSICAERIARPGHWHFPFGLPRDAADTSARCQDLFFVQWIDSGLREN